MRAICVVILCGLLTSCAGYCISDIETGQKGYIVYEPEPYILRTPDVNDKGRLEGWNFETVYFPNRKRGYRVTTWAGFGKADFTFEFENGWMLKGIQDKSDNTAVLSAISDLIPKPTDLLGAGVEGDVTPAMKPDWFKPQLYRFEYDECGRIAGVSEVGLGEVNLDEANFVEKRAKPCPTYRNPCR